MVHLHTKYTWLRMIVEPDSAVNRTFLTSPLNLPRPTLGSGRRVTTSAEQSCVELDIPLSVRFSPRLPSLSPFLLFSFPPLSRQQAFRCLVKATLRSRLHVVPPPNVILHCTGTPNANHSHALRRTFHMYTCRIRWEEFDLRKGKFLNYCFSPIHQ